MSVHRLEGDLYERIANVAKTLEFGFIPQAVCYIDRRLGFDVDELKEIKKWCYDNFKGQWTVRTNDTLYIETLEDASLFELAFGKPR